MSSEAFIEFVRMRENLRLRKELDLKPWTMDPILAKYRFTNIRRKDDRVSRWIIRHVVPLWKHPDFLPFLALCRWINWPPTLYALLPYLGEKAANWKQMALKIERLTAMGEKVWTGAYMIRGDTRADQKSKAEYVIYDVCLAGIALIGKEIETKCATVHTRRAIWELVRERLYWGDFMAGQFVDDLTWTKFLTKPLDDFDWAPRGPGSQRGFNRIMNRPLNTKPTQEEWDSTLKALWKATTAALIKAYGTGGGLTLMDLQNCLCEYDKYERVRLDEGRPRSHYEPHHYLI